MVIRILCRRPWQPQVVRGARGHHLVAGKACDERPIVIGWKCSTHPSLELEHFGRCVAPPGLVGVRVAPGGVIGDRVLRPPGVARQRLQLKNVTVHVFKRRGASVVIVFVSATSPFELILVGGENGPSVMKFGRVVVVSVRFRLGHVKHRAELHDLA